MQQTWNKRQEAVAKAAQEEADKAAAKLAAEAIAKVVKDNEGNSAEVLSVALQEAAEDEIAPPVILAATPKGGTKYRDHWIVEVDDLGLMIEHIAANYASNPKLLDFVTANQTVLNALAKLTKSEGALMPGARIVNDRIPVR